MHTKAIQKIQKAYIKTYEEDVKIYKDMENSQGQEAFFLQTPVGALGLVALINAYGIRCVAEAVECPECKRIAEFEKVPAQVVLSLQIGLKSSKPQQT